MSGPVSARPAEGQDRLAVAYWEALRLPDAVAAPKADGTEGNSEAPRRAALDRAWEMRNFEIEHYWKRATYFWGFQVAIFAAYGLTWKDGAASGGPTAISVALASLGVLTALANSLSMEGSKFWYTNWERHIDMLEDSLEGRLHKIVWSHEGGVSFSVTRVNRVLGWCFFAFWTAVMFGTALGYLGALPVDLRGAPAPAGTPAPAPALAAWLLVLACGVFVALGVLLLTRQRTRLEGTTPAMVAADGHVRVWIGMEKGPC